jgi:hypothetical protein
MTEQTELLVYQNELEVVFSMMLDKQLMELHTAMEALINERVYEADRFPLSYGDIRFLQATIMFSFWVRKGKGVRIEEGKVEVCELKESPFWHRYQPKEILQDEKTGKYYVDNPDHERDQPQTGDEERGEFV